MLHQTVTYVKPQLNLGNIVQQSQLFDLLSVSGFTQDPKLRSRWHPCRHCSHREPSGTNQNLLFIQHF